MTLNSAELQEKLNKIISDPQASVFQTRFRDFDRDIKYDFSRLSRMIWPRRRPDQDRTGSAKRRRVTGFTYGRHVTFDNIYDCNPSKQRMKAGMDLYKSIAKETQSLPAFYSNAYHMEYGKTSSFWSVGHVKDFMNDKIYFHGISMIVMMDTIKRKKINVTPEMKALCDDNYNNKYPMELKSKYHKLKNIFINDLNTLNNIRKTDDFCNKKPLFSCRIQLRYGDEDLNHHLNVATYMKFVYEGLMNYDKDLRNNKKAIYCMSNVYWNEIRIQNWNYCYCNIWNVINKNVNGVDVELYVGTIDIDKRYCKIQGNNRYIEQSNDEQHEWKHYHGFVVGVVTAKHTKSKL